MHTDRFSKIIVNGTPEAREWIAVRQTKNYQSNSGVTSVTSPDMRCFQNRAGTGTASIAAGDELGFVAETQITHFGPVQFYMAKVPDGADINTWDPAGNVWFKAASISAKGSPLTSGPETWPAYRTPLHSCRSPTANTPCRAIKGLLHDSKEHTFWQVLGADRIDRAASGAERRRRANVSVLCSG